MPKPIPHRGSTYRSFAVVHEDTHLIVVAKPSGVLTNQAESAEQTLEDQVRTGTSKSPEPDVISPTVVHRLDRFTSGLVILARTQRALEALNAMVRDGVIEKRYWVLTVGVPKGDRIDAALERHEDGKKMMRVSTAEYAQAALTEFSIDEKLGDFALVAARIHTGRTHQLRVHFAHIGCPVAGDSIYGDRKANAVLRQSHGLQRQFIHARELKFVHPVTGAKLSLQAKLPKDLSRVLKSLRDASSV
jgi:RluA family pseudouridine synthase